MMAFSTSENRFEEHERDLFPPVEVGLEYDAHHQGFPQAYINVIDSRQQEVDMTASGQRFLRMTAVSFPDLPSRSKEKLNNS